MVQTFGTVTADSPFKYSLEGETVSSERTYFIREPHETPVVKRAHYAHVENGEITRLVATNPQGEIDVPPDLVHKPLLFFLTQLASIPGVEHVSITPGNPEVREHLLMAIRELNPGSDPEDDPDANPTCQVRLKFSTPRPVGRGRFEGADDMAISAITQRLLAPR